MNASVSWQGDMTFVGEADTGFSVTMDSSTAGGGHDSGFRPTEPVSYSHLTLPTIYSV